MARISAAALAAATLCAWPAMLRAQAAPALTPALPAGYLGSENCGVCHEDIYKAFAKNPHNAVETGKSKWRGIACEACHGPGAKHAESSDPKDIRNPGKMTAVALDQTCLACHRNGGTQVGRIESSHAKNQVSCIGCHDIHGHSAVTRDWNKPAAINAACGACHSSQLAQFGRPFRHKIPEGAMSCVDCHNPHGAWRPGMMQFASANEPGCLKCHSDLRGPFTFEHAPMRMEGCGACHEPHGSANAKMLTRQEVRFVCLECHANLPNSMTAKNVLGTVPSARHDLFSPTFRNCTVCHAKIHGSHVDRYLEH